MLVLAGVLVAAGLLLLLLGLALYSVYAQRWSKRARGVVRIPGPSPLPIIGNALDLAGNTSADFLRNITKMWVKYGFFIRAWMGTQLYVFIAVPELAEILLNSNVNIKKNINYTFLEPWLGTGLLTSAGNKWKQNRKLLTPTFHFKILEQFVEVFNTNGDILIKKLQKSLGQEINICEYISSYTLDVICEAAMGVKMQIQENKNFEYLKAVSRITEIITMRSFNPMYFPDTIYYLSSLGREQNACVKVLHGLSNKIIADRHRTLFSTVTKKETTEDDDVGCKKRMAFLDLLLHYNKEGGNLTLEEIREEVDTFMFEGHDTTSSALSFTLWMLASHPECQEKAYQELYDIFGDSNREVTSEDLTNMKYVECVIKETLRLYPSVPFFLRELVADVDIGNGNVLTAGTTVMMAPFFLHRHPRCFERPLSFEPERFSKEAVRTQHPYAYVPFSAGPRNCIGQKFAMMELKSILAKILRNYKLFPGSKEVVLSLEVVLRNEGGIYLKLEKRN